MGTRIAEPESETSRDLPWDVAFVSWITLALWSVEALVASVLIFPFIFVPRQQLESAAVLLLVATMMLTAGVGLRLLRPWARLWLILFSLLPVLFWVLGPPVVEELSLRWRQWRLGGWHAVRAARWMAEAIVPVVTLLVLARPRSEFPPLVLRERAVVAAGMGLVVFLFGHRVWLGRNERDDLAARLGRSERVSLKPGSATVTLRPTVRGGPLLDVTPERLSVTFQRYDAQRDGTTVTYSPREILRRP